MKTDESITLYHGTGRYYEGTPTRGHDVLGTGALSMTASPDIAEFFAGGGRDGRVYSLAVPRSGILDLRRPSAELRESGEWDRLASLIRTATEDGYAAVAISDITFGSDSSEFRLLRVPAEGWTVRRSAESLENYAHTGLLRSVCRNSSPVSLSSCLSQAMWAHEQVPAKERADRAQGLHRDLRQGDRAPARQRRRTLHHPHFTIDTKN